MERSFVARNLRKCISYRDLIQNPTLDIESKRLEVAKSAASNVDNPHVFRDLLRTIKVKSKAAYTVNKIENRLILKLLSNNLKSTYRLTINNREHIVRNLISFLKESSPYHIHRYDLKSFYENIDRRNLLNKVKNDGLLSKKNIDLLKLFFEELERTSVPGLPRGLGISATLSELALKNLDKKIEEKEGIFLYERFVDDIILITDTSVPAKSSREAIEELLPPGVELHKIGSDKTYFCNVSKPRDNKPTKDNNFSYLGYSYTATEKNSNSDEFLKVSRRLVKVDICPEKVKKIKNRIIKSFTSYIRTNTRNPKNYSLLIKRIKFLSGNYHLQNSSYINNVKSGIYYNYRLINQDNQLEELDRFLKSLLFYKGTNLSKRIQSVIPIKKRRELAHFSFKNGHQKKRFHTFSYKDFVLVKRAWR